MCNCTIANEGAWSFGKALEAMKEGKRVTRTNWNGKGQYVFIADTWSFGKALEAMKEGKRVTRTNWNGKGQYVFIADNVEFHTDADISEFSGPDVAVFVAPMFVLRTAQGNLQPGWLATQSDLLAEDWYAVI